jgi:hypothetical protein
VPNDANPFGCEALFDLGELLSEDLSVVFAAWSHLDLEEDVLVSALGEGLLDQLESRVREVLTNGQDVKTYVEL